MDFDDLIMVTGQTSSRPCPRTGSSSTAAGSGRAGGRDQDTNHAQYILIRELVSGGAPLFSSRTAGADRPGDSIPPRTVRDGDADQSIYAFLACHHPQHRGVRAGLPGREGHPARAKNYRSTQNILAGRPNAVVSQNRGASPRTCGPTRCRRLPTSATWPTTSTTRPRSWPGDGGTGSPTRARPRRAGGGVLPDQRAVRVFEEVFIWAAAHRWSAGCGLRATRGLVTCRYASADRQPGGRGVAAAGAGSAQARHRRPAEERGRVRAAERSTFAEALARPATCRAWRPGRPARSRGSTR